MKRKQDRSQILKFQRYTQGMTNAQKFEYLRMSESERDQYLKSQNRIVEKEEKLKEKEKDIPVKIIKEGQVCVSVLNMRGKPLMPTNAWLIQ